MSYLCPLCGLRFGARTILEFHVREDHRPRRAASPREEPAPATPSRAVPASERSER